MKHINSLAIFILFFVSLDSFCQSNDQVEMADILRRDGKIYTVVFGLVIILTAMIILLIRVDRKLFHLEKQTKRDD